MGNGNAYYWTKETRDSFITEEADWVSVRFVGYTISLEHDRVGQGRLSRLVLDTRFLNNVEVSAPSYDFMNRVNEWVDLIDTKTHERWAMFSGPQESIGSNLTISFSFEEVRDAILFRLVAF